MKIQFIATVVGPLGPDVLQSLAKVSRELGAEWLASKLIMLDGQFAAMMKVSIDDDKEAALRDNLAREFPALGFVYAPVAAVDGPVQQIQVELDCNDRPGLTRDVNDVLANLGVSVSHMESHRVQVTSLGRTLFNACLSVALPPEMDIGTLTSALEAVEPNARVHYRESAFAAHRV